MKHISPAKQENISQKFPNFEILRVAVVEGGGKGGGGGLLNEKQQQAVIVVKSH